MNKAGKELRAFVVTLHLTNKEAIELRRRCDAALKEERERCAKKVRGYKSPWQEKFVQTLLENIAKDIEGSRRGR